MSIRSLLAIGVALACGCASVLKTAVVDGVVVRRPTLEFTGQPYSVRHYDAYPVIRGPSSGLVEDGGRIAGQVCGMDVEFTVQHRGDHVQLTGFLDGGSIVGNFDSEIQVRDQAGQRVITGNLGRDLARGTVELQLGSNRLVGRVGLRRFDMKQVADSLVGVVRLPGSEQRAEVRVNGRDALWSLPPGAQAAILPALLTCFVARIGHFGFGDLDVGLGGRAGAMPPMTSSLYGVR